MGDFSSTRSSFRLCNIFSIKEEKNFILYNFPVGFKEILICNKQIVKYVKKTLSELQK